MSANPFAREIDYLVNQLKRRGYIKTESMEHAFRSVPREEYVLPSARRHAYKDSPLSIGHGQTISAPHMCVIMCEGLKLEEGMIVLEVGAGSGYHAALCAEMIAPEGASNPGHVYTIEIVKELIDFARANLERTGYADRVTLIYGDGGKGLPEKAPFDRIFVAAAAPTIPSPLLDQLKPGGIMLIPVGSRGFYQELMLVEKDLDSQVRTRRWGGVAFVPLTGEYGH
ncbi:MAG: protein-L-isoaspartate(D-aspartate) O-methyltransferase [Candidatus Thorarchaeota archaeon]|nr:protein-L-isoaspartate(D-aspartate) O-methyltransferase [Candidatus Thorarchaeota archaeon]